MIKGPGIVNNSKQMLNMQGFTLVEALIAGVLMTFVIASVGRLSLAALASSGNQKERNRIEGAIENSIQNIQHLDSQTTEKSIPENHLRRNDPNNACIAPGAYLAHRLAYGITLEDDWINVSTRGSEALTVPYGVNSLKIFYIQPNSTNLDSLSIEEVDTEEVSKKTKIVRETMPIAGNPFGLRKEDINLTIVEYEFQMPESKSWRDEKISKIEKRIIELNPYFQGTCYEL